MPTKKAPNSIDELTLYLLKSRCLVEHPGYSPISNLICSAYSLNLALNLDPDKEVRVAMRILIGDKTPPPPAPAYFSVYALNYQDIILGVGGESGWQSILESIPPSDKVGKLEWHPSETYYYVSNNFSRITNINLEFRAEVLALAEQFLLDKNTKWSHKTHIKKARL